MKLLGKTPQTRRIVLALGLAFASVTTATYAGTPSADLSAAISVYNSDHPTATQIHSLSAATGVQVQALMTILTSSTATLTGTESDLNVPGDGPADATYIMDSVSSANLAAAGGGIVKGWYAGVGTQGLNSAALITGTFGQVTANAAAAASFEPGLSAGTVALDNAENLIIGDAITLNPDDLQDILVKSLTTYDPSPVDQAEMIALKATNAALNLAGTNLSTLTQAIAANDLGSIVSSGTFLYTLAVKETTSTTRQAVVEGFTHGDNLAAINTIAASVGVAESNSTTAFLGNSDVFIGLVTSGSGAGDNVSSAVTDAAEGLLAGVVKPANAAGTISANTETDTARGTLASTFITDLPTYANTIATAAATELAAPAADSFLLTADLVGNANVKVATLTGSNSVVGVAEAVADTFPLTDVTNATSTNIQAKEGAAEAAIKALGAATPAITGSYGGGAGAIVADIANQVLSSGTTATAEITFAKNFISAIDTKNANTLAINAPDRAYAAIGLAQDYDANNVANAAAAIAETAVETYDTTALDLNGVAQPILQAYATTSATEAESIAAAIAQDPDNYGTSTLTAYTPAYIAAQLILASRLPGSTTLLDQAIVGEVAIGVTTTPATIPLGADTLITTLGGDLSSAADLTALKYVENDLVSTGSFSGTFLPTKVITDLSATGAAPLESGTLAAVLAQTNPSVATALAYAGANGTGVLTDPARYTIAEDVIKNSTGDAPAISGSVGTLIAVTDKKTFVSDVLAADGAANALTDVSAVTLNLVQSVPTNDTGGTGAGNPLIDIAAITKAALLELTTLVSADKTTADVAPVIENIATKYTGSLASGVSAPAALTYGQVASLTGLLLTDEGTAANLATLGNALVTSLIPTEIAGNSNSAATAALIAGSFAADVVSVTPATELAIALATGSAATEASLYTGGNALTAAQAGAIVASEASSLPATVAAGLSGTLGVIAVQAQTNLGVDDALSTVAGSLASAGATGALKVANWPATALILAHAAVGTPDAMDSVIPAIAVAFTSQTTIAGVTNTTTAGIEGVVDELSAAFPMQGADILGYALAHLPAGAPASLSGTATGSLFADVYSVLTTGAAATALETALETTPGTPLTLLQLEALLKTPLATHTDPNPTEGILNDIVGDVANTSDFAGMQDGSLYYGYINPAETPVDDL